MIPSPANPQSWNRYSYVQNNPIAYNDPTGHMIDDGCQDYGCGSTTPVDYDYNPGNHYDGDEEEDDDVEPIIPVAHPASCSGCPMVTTVVSPFPSSMTYHFLDKSVIYRLPIYDHSYYPPKIIGYQMLYYTQDDVHFSMKDFLIPSDPLTLTSTVHDAANALLWLGERNLGRLSKFLAPLCPECFSAIGVMAALDSANSAITIDGHLETDFYYLAPGFPIDFNTPFDPKKIQ
jgi:hypothetical protein